MSHIHIPDGVLPFWLWFSGYIITIICFLSGYFYLKKNNEKSKFPIISIIAALMLLSMSIPLPFPIPYHINLAVLTGIILGPVPAFFAILITNLLLAFTAHGGITVLGLNTIVISIEATLGFLLFKFLIKKSNKIFFSAFISTILALIFSAFLTTAIVYAGTHDLNSLSHKHNHEHNHEHKQDHKQDHEHERIHDLVNIQQENNLLHVEEQKHNNNKIKENFNIKKFFTVMIIFGMIGWLIEASLTSFIISYIYKIKPEIINVSKG